MPQVTVNIHFKEEDEIEIYRLKNTEDNVTVNFRKSGYYGGSSVFFNEETFLKLRDAVLSFEHDVFSSMETFPVLIKKEAKCSACNRDIGVSFYNDIINDMVKEHYRKYHSEEDRDNAE